MNIFERKGVIVRPIKIEIISEIITVIGISFMNSPSNPETKAIGRKTNIVVKVPDTSATPISLIAAEIALRPFLPFLF